MQKPPPTNPPISSKKMKVWVLAPYLQKGDDNINYYYDFSQSIVEYSSAFEELDMEWVWQPITITDYAQIIDNIVAEKETGIVFPVVFNICDGDEINGSPGISVVKLLQQKGLVYTGADEYFYDITTSKIPMKLAFDQAGIPTARWEAIHSAGQQIAGIFERLGTPLIVKPAVSGGSMGLGIKNVVNNIIDLQTQIDLMFAGYRGWDLTTDGIVVESFINGNEYTTLIVGSYDQPALATIYNPIQRVFHPSLPEEERILSFDRLWELYEEEEPMPNDGNFYEYEAPDPSLLDELKKISWDAFVATKGKGYTRVDIRQDSITGKLYVLEVNAQCGLSEDEDYTSIGAILRLSNKTFSDLVKKIIHAALLTATSDARNGDDLSASMKRQNKIIQPIS
jgi:D-alanine-D-alanine ligase